MEIIRVDENTIKCIISEDDMQLYNVSVEDFFTRSESAMEFLHILVEQAKEEVDYKPDGPLTSLQISPNRDNGIIIVLSENSQVQLSSLLKNLKKHTGVDIPQEIIDEMETKTIEEQQEYMEDFVKNVREEIARINGENRKASGDQTQNGKKKTKEQQGKDHNDQPKMFVFDSISDVFHYAKAVAASGKVKSKLLKDEDHGNYYLLLERNGESIQSLASVFMNAYEFGHFVTDQRAQIAFILEHCQCLIEENVIEKLRG